MNRNVEIQEDGDYTLIETTVEDTIDLEVEERDAEELAERYANFYNGLKRRGIHVDHAATLTGDLLWREQERSMVDLPELSVSLQSMEHWADVLEGVNDVLDAMEVHGFLHRDHVSLQKLERAARALAEDERE